MSGHFFAGGVQIALCFAPERLAILDADTGATRYLATVPGLTALLAVDLDGDGRDELIVAAQKALWRATRVVAHS